MICFCFGLTALTTYLINRVKPPRQFLFTLMLNCSSEKPENLRKENHLLRQENENLKGRMNKIEKEIEEMKSNKTMTDLSNVMEMSVLRKNTRACL